MSKKNIVIFGGSGLIGKSIINSELFKMKYNFINIDLKKKNLKNFYKFDLKNYKNLHKILDKIHKKFGKIEGIINCVYPKVLQRKKLLKVDTRLLQEEIAIHFGIYFNINKVVSSYFIKKKITGKIINFSSIYAEFNPRFEIYKNINMTMPIQYMIIKNSINSMVKYFSKYLLKEKINFFTISPGGVFDEQNRKFTKEYKKFCNRGLLENNDINGLILFLLSDYSQKMRGVNFIIDDGFTL